MVGIEKLHIVNVQAVIEKDGKFLAVKRNPHEIVAPDKWSFPGGKVERGESITQALKREAMEETGLEIEDNTVYICDSNFMRKDDHVISISFLCHYKSGEVKLDKSHSEFKWMTLEEMKKHDFYQNPPRELKELEKD